MTNDTKAATVSPEDARVDVIKRTAQYGSLSVGQNDVLFLIARIEALQAEITALKTALDELLDWVNGERRTSDDRLAEIESMLPSKGEL